jgi:hypothetical protein
MTSTKVAAPVAAAALAVVPEPAPGQFPGLTVTITRAS